MLISPVALAVVSLAVPAHSAVTDTSQCQFMNVHTANAHHATWNRNHDMQSFGRGVTFNGITLRNATDHAIMARVSFDNACK